MADRFYDEEDNAFVFFVQNESCEVGIYISNANGLDGYHGADECEAFIDKYVGEDIEEIDGESVTATVSTISGKTTISADIVGSDNNLYKITLFYQLPTPEDTVNITLSASTFYNRLSYGYYAVADYTADSTYYLALGFNTTTIAGIYSFTDLIYDNSYLIEEPNTQDEDIEFIDILDANITVALAEDSTITIIGTALCSNSVLYNISITTKYEKFHIEEDEQTGSVDRTYNGNTDIVTVETKYLEYYGVIELEAVAADASDMVYLEFYTTGIDGNIVIPAGIYTISGTGEEGTVTMGSFSGETVYPSFYGTLDAEDYITAVYFLADGTVTVENNHGALKVTVDAANSYDRPIHIVIENISTTAIEYTTTDAKAYKTLTTDGTLLLHTPTHTFTATGVLVK